MQPLAEMSEGQRKKFYLALAFSGDATLLILDEPTNHLDDAGRKTLAEWIAQRAGASWSSAMTVYLKRWMRFAGSCRTEGWLMYKNRIYRQIAADCTKAYWSSILFMRCS
ncbi:MAG: AAA family ATPase [Gallintestinimicrobium sp.]